MMNNNLKQISTIADLVDTNKPVIIEINVSYMTLASVDHEQSCCDIDPDPEIIFE